MPEMEGIESQLKSNDARFEDILIKHDKVCEDLNSIKKNQVSELLQQMQFMNQSLQNMLVGKEEMQAHFSQFCHVLAIKLLRILQVNLTN